MAAGGTASFVGTDETPAVPHSSPKRARETEEEGNGGDQPLTLALLQQALQVNQQQITSSLHESLGPWAQSGQPRAKHGPTCREYHQAPRGDDGPAL